MYIVYIPFPDLYTYMRICMCWPEPGSDSAFIRSAFNVALPPFCRIICGRSSAGVFRDDVAGLRLPFDPLKNQIDRLCLLRVRKRHSSPYPPPLLHTAAAATGSGMHSLEDRMSALFSTSQYRLAACVTDTSTPGMAAMVAANRSAKYTERCCPPVHPNAT